MLVLSRESPIQGDRSGNESSMKLMALGAIQRKG